MKFLINILALSFTTSLFAADSSWILCKGKVVVEGSQMNIVINSLEHRAGMDDEGNSKRVNDITLIMGNRLIVGQLDTSNDMNGTVALATSDGSSRFDGIVIFDYSKPSMTLRGKLVVDEELSSMIAVKTTCENMN